MYRRIVLAASFNCRRRDGGGQSFLGLLTRVEIGHIRLDFAGSRPIRSRRFSFSPAETSTETIADARLRGWPACYFEEQDGGANENGSCGCSCFILCRNRRSGRRQLQGPSGGQEPPRRGIDQFHEKVLQRPRRCTETSWGSEDELHQEMLVRCYCHVKRHSVAVSRSTMHCSSA
jgi:hypothetical protein